MTYEKSEYLADKASLTTFLNSLFREWDGWILEDGPSIAIRLSSGESLVFPLSYYSLLGRHEYKWPPILRKSDGWEDPLDFAGSIECMIQHLSVSAQWINDSKETFLQRVLRSRTAIRDFLDQRDDEEGDRSFDFRQSEKHLFLGHSFHPCPKSRDGFSPEDLRSYSPEFGQEFALHWWAVDPEIFFERRSSAFADVDWIENLRVHEEGSHSSLKRPQKDYRYLPLHPWQATYLQKLPRVADYIREGRIEILGSTRASWMATSSVRAIHSWSSPYMLKTSLSVRLTNSVRNLLPQEVERGMQVHEVFSSPLGQDLLQRFPKFHVLFEPAYVALKDADGKLIAESILVCRSNPFHEKSDVCMLASLNQVDPDSGETRLAWHLRALANSDLSIQGAGLLWFRDYCEAILRPLITAQADYGILLGAHQQNILVGLEGHRPASLYFRDCQGTGYSLAHAEELRQHIPSLDDANGNILPAAMSNTLLGYYLMINSSFNVIVSIARASSLREEDLLNELRFFLLKLRSEGMKDNSLIDHLLGSESLLHKGNFFCSFENINENTSANPLAIYREIVNPIRLPYIERNFQ